MPANAAPIVDSVDMPTTATATNGTYLIKGTITFHDTDDTVTQLRLDADGAAKTPPSTFPTPVMSGTAPLQLTFTNAPAGLVVNYRISVIDARGLESVAVMKSVTLQ
jgi:hypothetical protein